MSYLYQSLFFIPISSIHLTTYLFTHAQVNPAQLQHPHPPKPRSLRGGQLRLSALMRVDGAVWAVELTTFTGLNENDPSSLAGLSPHWPNFIMANYHNRPLLFWLCWGPAPIYMDTLDTGVIGQGTARQGSGWIDDLAKKEKKLQVWCVCAGVGGIRREKKV